MVGSKGGCGQCSSVRYDVIDAKSLDRGDFALHLTRSAYQKGDKLGATKVPVVRWNSKASEERKVVAVGRRGSSNKKRSGQTGEGV